MFPSHDRSTQGSTPYGWAVTSNATTDPAGASPVGNLDFPENTSTSTGTFTHAVVYIASDSSADDQLYYGTISPNINFSQNVTPRLTTGSSITEQ